MREIPASADVPGRPWPVCAHLYQQRSDHDQEFQDGIGRYEDSEEAYEDSHKRCEDYQQTMRTTEGSFKDEVHRFEDGFS